MVGVVERLRISYQRTAAWLLLDPTPTVWLATSDSWPSAKRRYCRRFIRRSLMASRPWLVAGCWTQLRNPLPMFQKYVATSRLKLGALVAVPYVEFRSVLKSTWHFQIWKVLPDGETFVSIAPK